MSLRHYFTFLGGQMCKYQYRFNQFQHSKYSDNINKSIPYRRIKLNYLHLKLLKKKNGTGSPYESYNTIKTKVFGLKVRNDCTCKHSKNNDKHVTNLLEFRHDSFSILCAKMTSKEISQ